VSGRERQRIAGREVPPGGKIAGAVVGTFLASTGLRRSRVARLGAIGALAAGAYRRFGRRDAVWHDVDREPPR
jgi:hypothetical protein